MSPQRRSRLLGASAAALAALHLTACTGAPEASRATGAADAEGVVEVAVDGGDDTVVGTAPVRVAVAPGDVVRIRNANTGSSPTHLLTSVRPGTGPTLFTPVAEGAVPNAGVWGFCLGGTADAGTRSCPVPPVEVEGGWDGRAYVSLGPQLPGEVRELALAEDLAAQLGDEAVSLWCRLHPGLRVDLVAGDAGAPVAPATPAPATPVPTAPAPGQVLVAPASDDAELLAFVPSRVEVPVGTEVTWTVPGRAPHSVEFGGDPELTHAHADEALPASPAEGLAPGGTARSGYLSRDEALRQPSFALRFREPGTYRYVCRFHPQMTGEVVVTRPSS